MRERRRRQPEVSGVFLKGLPVDCFVHRDHGFLWVLCSPVVSHFDCLCVCVLGPPFREFTLDASVEMPFEINSLNCITHDVKMKVTVCFSVFDCLFFNIVYEVDRNVDLCRKEKLVQ